MRDASVDLRFQCYVNFLIYLLQVEVVLYKRDRSGDEDEWWPRLCYSRDRLPWLKVDFDRFAVSDSEPDDDPANDVRVYTVEIL